MKILTKKKEKKINDNLCNISKSYLCASRKLTEIEQLVLKAKSSTTNKKTLAIIQDIMFNLKLIERHHNGIYVGLYEMSDKILPEAIASENCDDGEKDRA